MDQSVNNGDVTGKQEDGIKDGNDSEQQCELKAGAGVTSKFYVLLTPRKADSFDSPDKNIFTDFKEVSNSLKSCKNSRIKVCYSHEDALNWSSKGLEDYEEPPSCVSAEKFTVGQFSSPSPQDLSKLRRSIERGDLESVMSCVTANPRYLISAADSPVILMEGPRYNAVHIAVKSNKHEILSSLLDYINDPESIRRMYPCDNSLINEERRAHLLDLYLNMPDKASLDTPLHFACKFGSIECVRILLRYPGCVRNQLNKFDKKPSDVVCERKADANAKETIKNLLEAQFYITIARNDDRVVVQKPTDSLATDKSVTGIAGPMNVKLANELYQTLKSPIKSPLKSPVCSPVHSPSPLSTQIRLVDASRGVERITRMECHSRQLNWAEYWSFLDSFIDLSSEEGLRRLEQHLKKVYQDLRTNIYSSSPSSPPSEKSTMSLLCQDLNALGLSSDEKSTPSQSKEEIEEIDESFITPPSSPLFENQFFVNGPNLTQDDKDAVNALNDVSIDMSIYPYTYHWYQNVTSQCLYASIPNRISIGGDRSEVYSSTPTKAHHGPLLRENRGSVCRFDDSLGLDSSLNETSSTKPEPEIDS